MFMDDLKVYEESSKRLESTLRKSRAKESRGHLNGHWDEPGPAEVCGGTCEGRQGDHERASEATRQSDRGNPRREYLQIPGSGPTHQGKS